MVLDACDVGRRERRLCVDVQCFRSGFQEACVCTWFPGAEVEADTRFRFGASCLGVVASGLRVLVSAPDERGVEFFALGEESQTGNGIFIQLGAHGAAAALRIRSRKSMRGPRSIAVDAEACAALPTPSPVAGLEHATETPPRSKRTRHVGAELHLCVMRLPILVLVRRQDHDASLGVRAAEARATVPRDGCARGCRLPCSRTSLPATRRRFPSRQVPMRASG